MLSLNAFDKISSVLENAPGTMHLAESLLGLGLLSNEAFRKCYKEGSYRLFLDMDGVLTNWEKQYKKFGGKPYQTSEDIDWGVTKSFEFWATMEWLPGGKELWETLAPLRPIILSSPGYANFAKEGKMDWVRREIGSGVQVILEADKYNYADSRSLLVDDMKHNIEGWGSHGGIPLLYSGSVSKLSRELYRVVVK
jgi:hypothetical protein